MSFVRLALNVFVPNSVTAVESNTTLEWVQIGDSCLYTDRRSLASRRGNLCSTPGSKQAVRGIVLSSLQRIARACFITSVSGEDSGWNLFLIEVLRHNSILYTIDIHHGHGIPLNVLFLLDRRSHASENIKEERNRERISSAV